MQLDPKSVQKRSIDELLVFVPENLQEKFEEAIQEHLTRPMRLKDGITIAADSFVADVEFEDKELVDFHIAIMEYTNGTAFEPDGYFFTNVPLVDNDENAIELPDRNPELG